MPDVERTAPHPGSGPPRPCRSPSATGGRRRPGTPAPLPPCSRRRAPARAAPGRRTTPGAAPRSRPSSARPRRHRSRCGTAGGSGSGPAPRCRRPAAPRPRPAGPPPAPARAPAGRPPAPRGVHRLPHVPDGVRRAAAPRTARAAAPRSARPPGRTRTCPARPPPRPPSPAPAVPAQDTRSTSACARRSTHASGSSLDKGRASVQVIAHGERLNAVRHLVPPCRSGALGSKYNRPPAGTSASVGRPASCLEGQTFEPRPAGVHAGIGRWSYDPRFPRPGQPYRC